MGDPESLQKVLFLAYGREGKRRRQLVSQLLRPDESNLPVDNNALESLIRNPNSEQGKSFKPTPKFLALLKSQQANHPSETHRGKLRQFRPRVPDESMWGRPLPLKRQASMRQKFWADTLDKLLPPVSLHEWERLRDLSMGKQAPESLLERRNRRISEFASSQGRGAKSQFGDGIMPSYEGIEKVLDNYRKGMISESTEQAPPTAAVPCVSPTKRVRVMRRLYAQIWRQTPTMWQDEETKKWQIKWGEERSPFSRGEITKPSKKDAELFEGTHKVLPAPLLRSKSKRNRQTQCLVA